LRTTATKLFGDVVDAKIFKALGMYREAHDSGMALDHKGFRLKVAQTLHAANAGRDAIALALLAGIPPEKHIRLSSSFNRDHETRKMIR
jgi:hypothetical protein